MWHAVKYIAESRNLNSSDLEGFAIVNAHKYGITVNKSGLCEVSSWYVDAFVADFKKNFKPDKEN